MSQPAKAPIRAPSSMWASWRGVCRSAMDNARATLAGRLLAVEVIDSVVSAEHQRQRAGRAELPAARGDLAAVGVFDDVGLRRRADNEETNGLVASIDQLVGALAAGVENDDLTGCEEALARGGAKRRAAAEDDQHLLEPEVGVVGEIAAAGRELIDRRAEPARAGGAADAGAAQCKRTVLDAALPVVAVDVRAHGADASTAPSARSAQERRDVDVVVADLDGRAT